MYCTVDLNECMNNSASIEPPIKPPQSLVCNKRKLATQPYQTVMF
jgi:hypothetical protein